MLKTEHAKETSGLVLNRARYDEELHWDLEMPDCTYTTTNILGKFN